MLYLENTESDLIIKNTMLDSIEIVVYLHSTLIGYSPDGKSRKFVFTVPGQSTIEDLVNQLNIAHPSEKLLYGLNGEAVDETARLSAGDSVHIMLPVSGG